MKKIVQTYMILDLLDLLYQAGFVFNDSLGNQSLIPGPRSFDGVILGEGDPEKSDISISLTNMLFNDLNTFTDSGYDNFNLYKISKEDFSWYGPSGIGVCKGITGFQKYHQIPWISSFPNRMNKEAFASFGENNYAFIGGWHMMSATHLGSDWMGVPATGAEIDMRCIDWWRIEDGRVAENWVNLDIIHILYQMGIDIFERVRTGNYLFKR